MVCLTVKSMKDEFLKKINFLPRKTGCETNKICVRSFLFIILFDVNEFSELYMPVTDLSDVLELFKGIDDLKKIQNLALTVQSFIY